MQKKKSQSRSFVVETILGVTEDNFSAELFGTAGTLGSTRMYVCVNRGSAHLSPISLPSRKHTAPIVTANSQTRITSLHPLNVSVAALSPRHSQ